MYGEISEDQTWDFSTYNLKKLGLAGGPSSEDTRSSSPLTRAAIPGLIEKYSTGWYTVSGKTTTWLNTHLKEKENNTTYVSSFDWEKSSVNEADPLYVIPIYMGQTGMIWDLELVDIDNNTSSIVWSKSENIQYTEQFSNWEEFFYESYNSNEAPYTDGKLKTVSFSKPLSKLPEDYAQDNELIVAFTVGKEKLNGEDVDIPGSFWITLGSNSNATKITKENCPEFFNGRTGKSDVYNASMVGTDDLFHFVKAKNFDLNENHTLSSTNPNKVYLNTLLGQTIGDHTITVADLKTIKFVIDDSFKYPKDATDDTKFDHYFTFNTWGPERIRVFVKYYGGDSNDATNLTNNTDTQYTVHHTINKNKVQTRPIKIDINKLSGTHFAFNLKTTYRGDGDKDLSEIGDDHRSDKGFMSQINHFTDGDSPIDASSLQTALSSFGITLNDNFEFMVIGCEDAGANGKNSDQDYNDVVLLLVGNTLPTQSIKKRYMIEDLGATEDFDFNDIVVDVTETVRNVAGQGKQYTQTAAIRHLRGTIPFRVTIGNKTFGNSGIMCGHNCQAISYDPSQSSNREAYTWTHTVTGVNESKLSVLRRDYWNPDANNIKVEVWPNNNSEDGNSSSVTVYWNGGNNGGQNNLDEGVNNVQMPQIVEFPKPGKYPYIIATDQTVQWMDERISIPETWMKTHPNGFGQNSDFQQGTDNSIGGAGGNTDPKGNKLNNPKTISDGNIVVNNVDTDKDISSSSTLTIQASDFANIYQGDQIIVHVDGEKLYDNSKLVFKNPNDGSVLSVGTEGAFVANGDIMFSVNSTTLLNTLRTYGLLIDGQNVTVTKVTAQSSGGTVISNSNDIANSALVLSGNTTVISNYSDAVTINNNLQKLYVGDKIIVHVANLRTGSHLGFKLNSNGWPFIEGLVGASSNTPNVSVTGDLTFNVTSDNISQIKKNGIVINGQYVTVTRVDVQNSINKASSETAGSIKLDETSHLISGYSNTFTIAASKFSDLYIGDEIIFHVSNLRTGSALGVHFDNRDSNGNRDIVPGYGDDSNGNIYSVKKDITLAIGADNYSNLKQYGLFVNGYMITVDAVTVKPAGGASVITNSNPITGGTEIYSTRTVLNSWESHTISKDKFSSLNVGDKVVFHVDNLRGNSNSNTSALGLHISSPWGLVPGYTDDSNGNRYNITGDVVLDITSDNITAIKNGGLTFNGVYLTITGVSIVSGSRSLYSGDPVTKGNYDNWPYFTSGQGGASTLAGAITDDYTNITFYFSDTSGKIQFKTPHAADGSGGWTVLTGTAQYGESFSNGKPYTLKLTSAMISQINGGGGLLIQEGQGEGHSITIIKVTASKP